MSVTAQHAVVTGGGRGIGRAVASALTRAGTRVTVLGRSEEPLKEAVEAGDAASYLTADVTEPDALAEAIRSAGRREGPVEMLVANAGSAESAPFAKSGPDLFRRMFDLNVMGVVNAARAVLPEMTSRGSGRIVVVASMAGMKGYPYVTAYCAAKHAVVGLVRALAQEVATSGVTVNAVCPGYTDTDLVARSIAGIMEKTGRSREDVVGEIVRFNPQRRLVRPEEVASCVVFLCSGDAASVTGAVIPISGGES